MISSARSIGIDFGTTNSVVALGGLDGDADMVDFAAPDGSASIFRSALCFWEDDAVPGGVAREAGPWAIAEFLEYPQGSRFLQSFKSVAASRAFEHATIFEKRLRFEELGAIFLERLRAHAGDRLKALPPRVVVGRPVRYVGQRPDNVLARQRYDLMFAALEREVHYVYEPLGAAFSFAARLAEPATVLVADFGGGTSDFSVVRIAAPGVGQRCTPLGSAGVGIAGDRFDYRIMDNLVLPMLGKGGTYESMGKRLEIPAGHFTDFGDWSRLALMHNRRTLADLNKLKRAATDPAAIGRMIAVVENELGYPLYDAVARLKRVLSSEDRAHFHFDSAGVRVEADVSRADFERWIAPDLARIGTAVDAALVNAGVRAEAIDHVFLTGGSSLIPAVRRLFDERFSASRIASGDELTSIAHGLALIGQEADIAQWTVDQEAEAERA
ncbi:MULTISPECIES: Hsp70 family protein [Sphingobium]|uniref:Hsp70 family protein n=1 Tax=Sphingobium sp. MI1205 TaxID=407020 RepID=UPI0007704BDF|nr:Hsp70 family protein [Sphingobium sp. MI1205]AMK20080.1 molecular chaperone DnaK [Sphingobium sp. MI1205]